VPVSNAAREIHTRRAPVARKRDSKARAEVGVPRPTIVIEGAAPRPGGVGENTELNRSHGRGEQRVRVFECAVHELATKDRPGHDTGGEQRMGAQEWRARGSRARGTAYDGRSHDPSTVVIPGSQDTTGTATRNASRGRASHHRHSAVHSSPLLAGAATSSLTSR
jgi:hypothetical protein